MQAVSTSFELDTMDRTYAEKCCLHTFCGRNHSVHVLEKACVAQEQLENRWRHRHKALVLAHALRCTKDM